MCTCLGLLEEINAHIVQLSILVGLERPSSISVSGYRGVGTQLDRLVVWMSAKVWIFLLCL